MAFGGLYPPFYLNDVLVEPDALRLRMGTSERHVEPKVMALLVALSERPGQLWPRQELFPRLWPDADASDEAMTRIVYQLRQAFKSFPTADVALHTVSKRGYRLDAEVWYEGDHSRTGEQMVHLPAFSVAVLPISDVSSARDGVLLADGLTRDLTSLLSRTPRLRVAPYSSCALIDTRTASSSEIGRALQSRFIVSGSLSRHNDQVRIRAELEDATDGALIWAEKYETRLDDFFEVEEALVCCLSTAIATHVRVTQPIRLKRTGRFNLSAYEHVQAAETLRSQYGPDNAKKIVAAIQAALAIEPNDPVSRAALAVQLSQNVVSQWEDDPEQTRSEADALIREALNDAPSDPEVLAAAGIVATMFKRPDDAIHYLQLATARNPNDAHAAAVLGWQCCLKYADPAGISLIETAESRAPHHPRFGLWATYRATAHLFMLNHADGLVGARDAIHRTPRYYQPHLTCAWAHTGLGEHRAAQREIAIAQAMESPEILQKFVEEMRQWTRNSANREENWRVLDAMLGQ